jgi:hypothetical protein
VSADGTVVDFGFEFGKSPLRFDLRALKLSDQWPADGRSRPPKQEGLRIEDWISSDHPKLDGKPIELQATERSQSLRSILTLTVSSSAPIGGFTPLTRKASSYGDARGWAPCGRSTSPATDG